MVKPLLDKGLTQGPDPAPMGPEIADDHLVITDSFKQLRKP